MPVDVCTCSIYFVLCRKRNTRAISNIRRVVLFPDTFVFLFLLSTVKISITDRLKFIFTKATVKIVFANVVIIIAAGKSTFSVIFSGTVFIETTRSDLP